MTCADKKDKCVIDCVVDVFASAQEDGLSACRCDCLEQLHDACEDVPEVANATKVGKELHIWLVSTHRFLMVIFPYVCSVSLVVPWSMMVLCYNV